jgi:DNA-binding beta-propeller fold protein YncE
VAIAPDGSLVIADTWNFQIKRMTNGGSMLSQWGQPVMIGFDVPVEPLDGFWGPRDVAVDGAGNVYVADTGNKRVRVYDLEGNWLRDIGRGGSGDGQLDEPSGLAISADGRLYVADTWNRRVSVFALDGTPLFNFRVRGWYEDLNKRPYLAVDDARRLIYVTDPNAGRVLVYDLEGNCVGSFGQPTDFPVDGSQFRASAGIAVDGEGYVYVSDSDAGRVLRFEPFIDFPGSASDPARDAMPLDLMAVTAELAPETEAETTPESEG